MANQLIRRYCSSIGSPVVLSTKTRSPPEVANGCAHNYTWGVPWDLLLFRLGEKLREQNVHVQNFQRCKKHAHAHQGRHKVFHVFSSWRWIYCFFGAKKMRFADLYFKRLLIVRENGNGVNRSISWVGVKSDIGNLLIVEKTQVSWLNWLNRVWKKDEAFKWTVNVSRLIKVLWLSCQNLSYKNHASWEKWYFKASSLLVAET